jgi:diguanylate cyclase (GGDEF)-like protein/PAS domain S-box-containing protein
LAPALAGFRTTDDTETAPALLAELIGAQDRFPALFDEQRGGMVLFDLSGGLVRINRAALEFIGAGIEDLLGFGYAPRVGASDFERARSAFVKAAAGETVGFSARLSTAGFEAADIALTLSPALVDRAIVGVYCSAKVAPDAPTRKLQELTSLFVNTVDAVIVFDRNGRCVDANTASGTMTGYAAAELRGRHYRSLLAPEARPAARDVFARVLLGVSVSADTVFAARGGRRVHVSGTSVPIVVDGAVVGTYMIARDVTSERNLATALREQTERMRELYLIAASTEESVETQIEAALNLGCLRLHCDAGYVTRSQGESVTYLYGIGDAEGVLGSNGPLAGSLHERVLARGEAFAGDATDVSGQRGFVGTPLDVDGERVGALCLTSAGQRVVEFTEADRDFIGLLGTLVSSTLERDERRRRAELLAFHDPLTGLANRTLLGDRMEGAIASAERHQTVFAVHFYDLDNFKQINDERGHMRGDDVLRTVARRFESVARNEDTVARIGGDEFVVIQPGVRERADVESLANRLRSALGEPLIVGSSEYHLTASVGIAMFPADSTDAKALLSRADAALYRVKEAGRDGIAFYS